jgi:endogenous inhibitor of DNA gyrase (YacG/DUF329 family)
LILKVQRVETLAPDTKTHPRAQAAQEVPMTVTVECPTCQRPVPWVPESTWRPFCSERCRLIDLGDWLDESHRIPEPAGDELGRDWLEADRDDDRRHH